MNAFNFHLAFLALNVISLLLMPALNLAERYRSWPPLGQKIFGAYMVALDALSHFTLNLCIAGLLITSYLVDGSKRIMAIERLTPLDVSTQAIRVLSLAMVVSAIFWIIKVYRSTPKDLLHRRSFLDVSVKKSWRVYPPLILVAGYFLMPINSFNGLPDEALRITSIYDVFVIVLTVLSIINAHKSVSVDTLWRKAPAAILLLIFALNAVAVKKDLAPHVTYLNANIDTVSSTIKNFERAAHPPSEDTMKALATELMADALTLSVISNLSLVGEILSLPLMGGAITEDKSTVALTSPYSMQTTGLSTGLLHYGATNIHANIRRHIELHAGSHSDKMQSPETNLAAVGSEVDKSKR